MRNWTLVCAAVIVAGFMADRVPAQEPATIPATVTNTTEIVTPAPRTGLFGRLRERRGMTMTVNQPIIQAQAIQPQPIPPLQQPPSEVLQAQHTEQVAMPTTASTTMTTTTVMPAEMQVVDARQGLLARLRARRGR